MADHPRYQGSVVDGHCHFDESARDLVDGVLTAGGIRHCVNFWDLTWPPLRFSRWAELWAEDRSRMSLCHTPNLAGVGSATFESQLRDGLHEASRLGAVAVKVWKNLGLTLRDVRGRRVSIDDSRLSALWEPAGELDLPVVIHIGDAPAFFQPLTPANERYAELRLRPQYWWGRPGYPPLANLHAQFERVVATFPSTTFVGLHFGCFMSVREVMRMLRSYPNYFVDTATAISDLGREDPALIHECFVEFSDRIIFGTDTIRTSEFHLPDGWDNWSELERFFDLHWRYFETSDADIPLSLPYQGSWTMRGIELPAEVLERIYCANAVDVFGVELEISTRGP